MFRDFFYEYSYPKLKLKNEKITKFSIKYNSLTNRLMFRDYFDKELIKRFDDESVLNIHSKKHWQSMSRGPIAKKKKSLVYFSVPVNYKKKFLKINNSTLNYSVTSFCDFGSIRSLKKSTKSRILIVFKWKD